MRILLICLSLLLAAPGFSADKKQPRRTKGAVETRSKIIVGRTGEATVILDQQRQQEGDSVTIYKFDTYSTVKPTVPLDTVKPSEPFADTTFDQDVEDARDNEVHLLRRMKSPERMERDSTNWWFMLRHGKFSIRNPYITYPRGTNWIIKTVRFVDKILNDQDTTYIKGTGYHFKFYATTENWFDSYSLNINNRSNLLLRSDMTSSLGLYLNFIGLSFGYSIDMTNLIGGYDQVCHKWSLGFDTELVSGRIHRYTNDGGTYIIRMGDYNNNQFIHEPLPGMRMSNYGAELYFYVNNKRYSRAAAYSYSKIQRKSTGSIIAGVQYNNLNLQADLSTLSPSLIPYLGVEPRMYRYHYDNYAAVIGYGHNFVLGKHFLLNLTILPAIGWNRCYDDSVEGSGDLVSFNIKGGAALVYNNKAFFAAINTQQEGHWYRSVHDGCFDALVVFTGQVGFRF